MQDFTTTKMIADLKRQGSVPANQKLFNEDDFCAMFTFAQKQYVIPTIMKVREEFFVATYETPLVPGQSDYLLPSRTIGNKVRKVMVIDTQGNEVHLSRIEPENKTWHENYIWWPGTKSGYYFEGDKLILTPNMSDSYATLRIKYFRRPSELVDVTNAGQVTQIDTGTGIISLQTRPSVWVANRVIDAVNSKPPFQSRFDSVTISAVSNNTVTIPTASAALLSVGDWLCDEGETVVPQYPEELHPMLISFALIDVLKALGDSEGASNEAARFDEQLANMATLISNRDEGAPRKILSRRGIWDTGGI